MPDQDRRCGERLNHLGDIRHIVVRRTIPANSISACTRAMSPQADRMSRIAPMVYDRPEVIGKVRQKILPASSGMPSPMDKENGRRTGFRPGTSDHFEFHQWF
jgi:hypothetical protein